MENITIRETPRRKKRMNFGMYQAIKVVVFIVFALYAVSLAFPFFWMLFNSVKPNGEFLSGNIFGLPEKATFKNYVNILQYRIGGESIFQMFLTSVVLTVLGTFVNVFFSTISAYCVAKYNFPGKKLVMGVAIFTMIIPIVGTLPAQVQMMELFHLDDSMAGVLFLYSGCFGFNFILMHSSFESISWTYAEAAQIDGANRANILFQIMLPIASRAHRGRLRASGHQRMERLFHALPVHAFAQNAGSGAPEASGRAFGPGRKLSPVSLRR